MKLMVWFLTFAAALPVLEVAASCDEACWEKCFRVTIILISGIEWTFTTPRLLPPPNHCCFLLLNFLLNFFCSIFLLNFHFTILLLNLCSMFNGKMLSCIQQWWICGLFCHVSKSIRDGQLGPEFQSHLSQFYKLVVAIDDFQKWPHFDFFIAI